MRDPENVSRGPALPLKCLRCGGRLTFGQIEVKCLDCNAQWPLIGDIPRFYPAQNYYWGEVDRQNMIRLLADARQGSWKDAVRNCFKEAYRQDYCLDLQRASWLATLGLPPTAVGLDIGCGFGALTHSMALSLGEVYAVEAVPERIEFTQERLRQEGITNVSLLQASATALPFFENSFDLIVANGILEWIGEWDTSGSPRAAQLRFLASLQRLLKEDGVLLIGIENRFARGAFRGGLDHSGRAYTSIVPRWLATAMLHWRGKTGDYVLSAPSSTSQYRTYTYSPLGYRKILKESGLEAVSIYCARPGYNQPHRLIAFESVPLQIDDRERFWDWKGERKPFWRRKAKAVRNNLSPWFADSFVIVAAKSANRRNKLDEWLRKTLAESINGEKRGFASDTKLLYSTYTGKYRPKTVLAFWSPEAGRIPAIATVNARRDSAKMGDVELGYRSLKRVRMKLAEFPETPISVPRPLGLFRDGNTICALVSKAEGTAFNRIASAERLSGNLYGIRRDFSRLLQLDLELCQILNRVEGVPTLDPAWYQIPASVAEDASLADCVRRMRYFTEFGCSGRKSLVQHGDFDLGNIFFQEETGRFEIIDWDDMASGLPPLYDPLTLMIQAALARFTGHAEPNLSWPEWRFRSFLEAFIAKSDLASLVNELLIAACERLGINPSLIPSLIVEYLLIRTHYNTARAEPEACEVNLRMLRAYCSKPEF